MKQKLLQIIGWIGAAFILTAYFLVSLSVIDSASLGYQLLNLFGALGIVIETLSKKDYQPMALNAAWVLIALVSIIKSIS